jgi:cytochrome c peroxidase
MRAKLSRLVAIVVPVLFVSGCGPSATETAKGPAAGAAPKGLPPLAVPADNPMTPAKIELGKMLYFDKRLSKDGTVACATCHDPKIGWAEHDPVSTGIAGQKGGRNAPTVINAAYMNVMFWDGRMKTLEEQALGPIGNPIEMGMPMGDLLGKLDKVPEYKKRFKEVFGADAIVDKDIAKAIAAFERTVLSGDSSWDRFMAGDKAALADGAKRGWEIFQANCDGCHKSPVFSSSGFYNAGVGSDKEKPDEGRKEFTKKDADKGKFRVPHLREVAHTAPYFHDGSAKTLEEAVELMASGGKDNPGLSDMLVSVRERKLDASAKKDLVEFLVALSPGNHPKTEAPKLP